jgi:superfamily I DNA and/or RNA helicase
MDHEIPKLGKKIELSLNPRKENKLFFCEVKLHSKEVSEPFSFEVSSRRGHNDAKSQAFEQLYYEMKKKKLLGLIFRRQVQVKNVMIKLRKAALEKNLDEFKSTVEISNCLEFKTQQINEIYDYIVASLDLEFAEAAGSLVYEKLRISHSEFKSSHDCDYYKFSRFMVFFETIEGLMLNMRSLGRKTSIYLKINKTFNIGYYQMESANPNEKSENVPNSRDKSEGKEIKSEISKSENKIESEVNFDDENIDIISEELNYNSSISSYSSKSSYKSYSNSKITPDGAQREDRDLNSIIKNDYVLIKCESDPEIQFLGDIASIETDLKIRLNCRGELQENTIYKITKLTTSVPTETYTTRLREFCVNHKSCCDKLRSIITRSKDSNVNIHELASEKVNSIEEGYTLQNKYLTPNQREAVFQALTQRLTLIQGPPGTGKTRTAAEIVREWIKVAPNSPILVTADSNIAVDNIFKELKKLNIKALRVGSNNNLRDYFNTGSSSTKAFALMKKNPESINVVCATCVGSSAQILEKFNFERVIIDEAAQSTEVSNISTLVNKTKQLVIIGDHKQLPPTVQSKIAEKYGYSLSLFERLVNLGIKPAFLNIQYRMHPLIAQFPSQQFYDGNLLTGITNEDRPLIQGFNWPNKHNPVCFVNVNSSSENYFAKSYYNLTECHSLKKIYENFVNFGEINSDNIGVVTPYSAQKTKLVETLSKVKYKKVNFFGNKSINVNTVDGFQGMEKDLIIFSATRANNNVSFIIIYLFLGKCWIPCR